MCYLNIIRPSDCDDHPAKVQTKCPDAAEVVGRWCVKEKTRYLKAQDGFILPCLWCALNRGIGSDIVPDDKPRSNSSEGSYSTATRGRTGSEDREVQHRQETPDDIESYRWHRPNEQRCGGEHRRERSGETAIREARKDAAASRQRTPERRRSARREEPGSGFRSEGDHNDHRSARSCRSPGERGSPSRRKSNRDTWPPRHRPRMSRMPNIHDVSQMSQTPDLSSMPHMPPMPYGPQMPHVSPMHSAPGTPQMSYTPYVPYTPPAGTPTYEYPPTYSYYYPTYNPYPHGY